MKLKTLIRAALLGSAISICAIQSVSAQNVLKVLDGATSSNINVAVNRAIVMESELPFAEISVANPGIADIATLSERTLYVLGKTPGRTTLTLLGQDGELITNVDVQVSPDVAEFKERLAEILPNEPIEVRTANDGIVLSGRVSGARKVARAMELAERYAPGRVTNLMMVGGSQQVMLKVRFAEMQRSVAKNLQSGVGINNLLTTPINAIDAVGAGEGISGTIGQNGLTAPLQAGGNLGISFGVGGVAMDILIQALETKGMVRTLAEPNIVAISGQNAEFLAGGEFPTPTIDVDGNITIEYKPFGIQLSFKPTVIDDNIINLELITSVSAIDTTTSLPASAGNAVAFSTRRASTTVEMRDGQSFAIAGLLQDDFNDQVGQVPWLGDVPILGALFRSTEFQRRQSELVIIVSPHLVTPTDGLALALPTDRMQIPSETDLFMNGNVEGSAAVREIAQQDFQGNYGYVME